MRLLRKKTNKGRSMLEMLGVLAIIGILSVAGLNGFRYAMNKNRANKVMNDALEVYGEVETTEVPYDDWTIYPITSESALVFKALREAEGDKSTTYVQAVDVSKEVCDILLKMKTDKVSIFDVDSNGMMPYEEKEECGETNNMAFTFGGGIIVNPNGTNHGCEGNQYWNGNSCTSCPTGGSCDGENITNCGRNMYVQKDGNKTVACKNCPSYASCNGTDATCRSNYTKNFKSSGEVVCCKATQYWTGSYCVGCDYYRVCDGTNKIGCKEGYVCDDQNEIIGCKNGYVQHRHVNTNEIYCCNNSREFWSYMQDSCTACDHGYCDGTSLLRCEEGYYRTYLAGEYRCMMEDVGGDL